MSLVVIGIHGLGNKPPKKTLEKWWLDSIHDGLNYIGKTHHRFKFELVYWADLVYEKPLNEYLTDKEDPYYLEEKYVKDSGDYTPSKRTWRKKILDFLQLKMDRIFLRKDFSMNYSFITNAIIHRYFKDLEAYYNEKDSISGIKPTFKISVRERLAVVLRKHARNKIILIAHSMGSIIAYDVLTHLVPEISIDTFITLGSPLGLPVVKSKIVAESDFLTKGRQCLCTPPGIKNNWLNFADLEDNVSINYCLSDDYFENRNGVRVKDFTVCNGYTINRKRNHHHIIGYLRTREFADTFSEILTKGKTGIFEKVTDFILKIYDRIRRKFGKY